jgi:hypothetical protein
MLSSARGWERRKLREVKDGVERKLTWISSQIKSCVKNRQRIQYNKRRRVQRPSYCIRWRFSHNFLSDWKFMSISSRLNLWPLATINNRLSQPSMKTTFAIRKWFTSGSFFISFPLMVVEDSSDHCKQFSNPAQNASTWHPTLMTSWMTWGTWPKTYMSDPLASSN